jgi:hypothetical protein
MPYNPSPWTDDSDWSLEIECAPGEVFIFHGDRLRAPGFSTTEDRVAFALRYVCHILINQIDNKGLEEVCRSLAEFYTYYRPVDYTPQIPDIRTKRATLNTRTVSPAFLIEEE